MKIISSFLLTACVTATLFSCSKDSDSSNGPDPLTYSPPTTYNFTNFNNDKELKLLAMADQLGAQINLANTANTVVTKEILTDMFNNTGNHFVDSALQLNSSGLKLADYFPVAAQADMLRMFDSIGVYSQSHSQAEQGVAGTIASSASASKRYLLSPNGVFYSQVVKKAIMGMCAYQITSVYLKDSVSDNIDNTNVIPGSGTAMEHGWDQAFAFFAVPNDFPTTTAGSRYYGSYSNQVDAGLHSNSTIMNAFLLGRAAIDNKDLLTKQKQADLLVAAFDTLNAATIIQEMKETDENIDNGDKVAAMGTLSEAIGFVWGLKYNTGKRVITDDQINQLLALFDSAHPDAPDLYAFMGDGSQEAVELMKKTDAIRQFVAKIYGFSSEQLPNL